MSREWMGLRTLEALEEYSTVIEDSDESLRSRTSEVDVVRGEREKVSSIPSPSVLLP